MNEEFHPRETLEVAAAAKTLTLTNAQGQSLTFRRYTGAPLAEAEARRREADIKNAISPFSDILKQQGINVGTSPAEKAPARKK